MRFSIPEIENAARALKYVEPRLAEELKRMAKEAWEDNSRPQKDRYLDLINRNAYFATILWTKEDVKCALEEAGYKGTDNNIYEIMNEISVSDMEDCSNGWEIIGNTIIRCKEKLEEKDELSK